MLKTLYEFITDFASFIRYFLLYFAVSGKVNKECAKWIGGLNGGVNKV